VRGRVTGVGVGTLSARDSLEDAAREKLTQKSIVRLNNAQQILITELPNSSIRRLAHSRIASTGDSG
jgi:hypothetical protein